MKNNLITKLTQSQKYAGWLNINKPKGITSSSATLKIKSYLNAKVGHLGTLDPLA